MSILIIESEDVIILFTILEHVWEVLAVLDVVVLGEAVAKVGHLVLAGILLGLLSGLLLGSLLLLGFFVGWASHNASDCLVGNCRACSKGKSLHNGTSDSGQHTSFLLSLWLCDGCLSGHWFGSSWCISCWWWWAGSSSWAWSSSWTSGHYIIMNEW